MKFGPTPIGEAEGAVLAHAVRTEGIAFKKGDIVPRHSHENEQFTYVVEGALKFWFGEDDRDEVVVGPGEVPLSAVLRELGRTPIPVPHPLARPLLGTLFRYRLANFPPPELDHIQFLCIVDGSRWRADVGWVPQRSMKDTIRSVDGERAAA